MTTPSLHTALQREREACDRYILAPLEGTFGPWIDARRATDQALAALTDTLAEVAASGVEMDEPRIRYVTVQINRETWDELRAMEPGAIQPVPDQRPTLAEVEAAVWDLPCIEHIGERWPSLNDVLTALRALYGRGGV